MDNQNEEAAEKSKVLSKPLRCRTHGQFAEWLASSGGSLAVTAYTSGKLALVSSFSGRVRYRTRHFPRPMGLAFDGKRFALVAQDRIIQFRRAVTQETSRSEGLFLPEHEYHTGRLDAHEIAFGRRGLYFANTRYNCIARVSTTTKFICCWRPPFIAEMVRQDRCHLNGIGLEDGRPAMATAFCATDHRGDWREQDRFTGGVLIDVKRDQVAAGKLCMPHSPKLHKGQWWLCNSGHGTLEVFDPKTARCREVCALPGFTRGLCFVGDYALVGLSKVRREHLLDAPPVRERHAELLAGVGLVDLRTGCHVGTLEFVQGGREVFDVLFLPGIHRPNVGG